MPLLRILLVMAWQAVVDTTAGTVTPSLIAPQTPLGRAVETFLVALGYALFLVPFGIVVVEVRRAVRTGRGGGDGTSNACRFCGATGHAADAAYCRYCGGQVARAGDEVRP